MVTFVSAAPDAVQHVFEKQLEAALPRESIHDSVWRRPCHLSGRQTIDFDNWFVKNYAATSAGFPTHWTSPKIYYPYKSPSPCFLRRTANRERDTRDPKRGTDSGLAQMKAEVSAIKSNLATVKSDVVEARADIAVIKKNQVTEENIRAIVRQEVDKVRTRKPSKRRPALTRNAIRFAFDKWVQYCHNPSAVGCENGRKVKYNDVYDTFRDEFAKLGIADLTDFKRAIESSRKMFADEWKKLGKRRPYAKRRKTRQ